MLTAMVVGMLLLAGATSAQITPQLPMNPLFEELDEDGWAIGWERWPAVSPEPGAISLDANMPFRGTRSVRLHHDNYNSYTRVQQRIPVEPGQTYYFRVWMRGENLKRAPEGQAASARMYIEGLGGRDHYTSGQLEGSFGWEERMVGPCTAGQEGTVTLMLYLNRTTGTVWYDDVQVIPATADFESSLHRQRSERLLRADLDLARSVSEAAGDETATEELNRLAEGLSVDALPTQLDYRAGPPYFSEHNELFGIMARLNARRLPATTVAMWTDDPFAPFPVLGLVPDSGPPSFSVVMGMDERDQGVLNLCNLGERPLRLRVEVTGLDGAGAPHVTLREVVHVDAGDGSLLADALPRLPAGVAGPTVQLVPGLFRQLWLDVSSADAEPGRYHATVVLRGPGRLRIEAPLTIEVLPVALPDTLPIVTWNYSYQRGQTLIQDRWEQARADLAAHHINAYCWPPWHFPYPEFSEAGDLLPLDWTAFEEAVASHDNIEWLLLWPQFEMGRNLALRLDLEVGSALWEKRFIAWFRALIAGLEERGFGHDRIAWYPTDEPVVAARVNQQITAARAIHKADPQALVLANPYGACPAVLREQMGEVTDIWCPELNWAAGGLMPYFRETSTHLWTYQVLGKAPPFERHRLSFWRCWREGITGHGFWAYACCRGSNWDPYDGPGHDYAVIYDGDPDELIPSKRWEAWREGVEDYTYLWLLQQTPGAEAEQLQQEVDQLLADPSPRALAALREQVLRELARLSHP